MELRKKPVDWPEIHFILKPVTGLIHLIVKPVIGLIHLTVKPFDRSDPPPQCKAIYSSDPPQCKAPSRIRVPIL